MIEELTNFYFALARVTQGLGPGEVIEGPVIEGQFLGREALLALLDGYGEDSGADRLGAGFHIAGVGGRVFVSFDLQGDVAVADDDGGKRAVIG